MKTFTLQERQQREVLLTFYNKTNGKSWINSAGWNGEPGTGVIGLV